jgi:hypothetical protein
MIRNFSGLQSLFVVYYDHSTVGHLDLFEYQASAYDS